MRLAKRLVLAVSFVPVVPLVILTWLEGLIPRRQLERMFGCSREILSLFPTPLGEYLRLAYYWAACAHVSPDACFLFGSMVAHRGTTIGAGTVVGAFARIGYADIGNNVLIASGVSIISGKYGHGSPEQRLAGEHSLITVETISVGDNSWIGQDAILMAHVGKNCTVAAGSVVYKDVPDGVTVMGNPARKVSLDVSNER